ncbi:MAG: DUF2132 domain-containing protein [Spirochaetaceae bacterium]|nr:MAG: DUF2132 domain-containing protein [Spirochaetaceae bacterium]
MAASNDPLHGITLEIILTRLVEYFGWEALGSHIRIHSFIYDPSIKSSLKFLRRTDWARKKVEALYLDLVNAKNDENWWKSPRR